jgi:hypothetical protein
MNAGVSGDISLKGWGIVHFDHDFDAVVLLQSWGEGAPGPSC